MNRLLLLCTLLLFVFFTAKAQTALTLLKTKLLTADSIVLVSHEHQLKIAAVNGKSLPLQMLVVKGKPNPKMIRERKRLEDSAVMRLSKILARPFQDSIVETAHCFMPHHAVFIFSKGKLSYIDVCFGCHRLDASNDIHMSEGDFDSQKWDELYDFFVQNGFRYELNFDGS